MTQPFREFDGAGTGQATGCLVYGHGGKVILKFDHDVAGVVMPPSQAAELADMLLAAAGDIAMAALQARSEKKL